MSVHVRVGILSGSSPRVRGTRLAAGRRAWPTRFIPACAGNSMGRSALRRRWRGSSPRVRGTLALRHRGLARRRFIPACAGNSGTGRAPWGRRTVHPRVCGELGRLEFEEQAEFGSSPRVRGTLGRQQGDRAGRRFIPACAGNSSAQAPGGQPQPVHPRVCGELATVATSTPPNSGSSPRVRGTRDDSGPGPAPATVHPRVCGELRARQSPTVIVNGSSPRVRGTLGLAGGLLALVRFIPACAGNSAERPAARVHYCGSSPRVRGTLQQRAVLAVVQRFIPACAGNSTVTRSPAVPPAVHPRVCGELVRPGNDSS